MRLVLAVLVLSGCMDDADPSEMPERAPETTLEVAIGGHCDASRGLVCGFPPDAPDALGLCANQVCMRQCDALTYPRCAPGLSEHWMSTGANTSGCYCAP